MKFGVSIFLLATALLQCKAVEISFGEVDYRSREDNGVNVVVVKAGANMDELQLRITPLSEAGFVASGLTLPEDKFSSDFLSARRAQFEIDGRQDFDNSEHIITFPPSNINAEQSVFIPFVDDEINEPLEVFFVVVRAVNESVDSSDTIFYIRNGITLAVIDDNDPIRLSFERPIYNVMEEDATFEDLVRIIKEDGRLSEQTLQVLVQLNPFSGLAPAERGTDFEVEFNTSVLLVIPPDVNGGDNSTSVGVPFRVKGDQIAEDTEQFGLFLTVPQNAPTFFPGTYERTSIFIIDEQRVTVGFEQDVYSVSEEDGSVEVCLRILSPDQAELNIFFLASSVEGTATATDDFTSLTSSFIEINDASDRICRNIPIINDNSTESVESFTVELTDLELPVNVEVTRRVTRIDITDNDLPSLPPCDPNARLIEGECVCNSGYRGDGLTCTDINECATGAHNCNANARCINTPGSYRCQCRPGYTGNGFICIDINECRERTHNCNRKAWCTNTVGSFRCTCRNGYTGDGVRCRDINECAQGSDNCHRNAQCSNTPGSFRCTCRNGFRGNGVQCRDINECAEGSDNCHRNALCFNTAGSFRCICRRGFIGNGLECRSNRPPPPQSNPPVRPPRPTPTEDCDDDTNTRTRSRGTGRSRSGTTRSRCNERTRTRSTGTRTRSTGTHTHSTGTRTRSRGSRSGTTRT